tara:strand:- start:230 stop:508 length:279 start_codon:yes stop_codon:yes gene_type:complete
MIKASLKIIEIIGFLIRQGVALICIFFLWLYPAFKMIPFLSNLPIFLVILVVFSFSLISVLLCLKFAEIYFGVIWKYIEKKFNEFRDNLINK